MDFVRSSHLNFEKNSGKYHWGYGSQTTYFYDRCPICGRNGLTSRNVSRIRTDLAWCRKCYNKYYTILKKLQENGRRTGLIYSTILELENFEGWAEKEKVIAIVDVFGISRVEAEESLNQLLKEAFIYSPRDGIYFHVAK